MEHNKKVSIKSVKQIHTSAKYYKLICKIITTKPHKEMELRGKGNKTEIYFNVVGKVQR